MPTLTTSDDGISKLKEREGSIDGLYDDPSGYGTYGVGHLVHPGNKWKALLLDSARSDKLCDSRIKKQWPGTQFETPYLEREAMSCADYDKLKTKAKERACETIAQATFKKAYADLPDDKKAGVKSSAEAAVDREAQLLNSTVSDTFRQDLKPFEKAINESVTLPTLTQSEFDALVSFVFNVGNANFKLSGLLTRINENKYRSGEATDRAKAIGQIENAFLAWNKSAGIELAGLTKRRQAEADQFLINAREELNSLKAAKDTKGVWLLPPLPKRGTSLASAALRGVRPDRPV